MIEGRVRRSLSWLPVLIGLPAIKDTGAPTDRISIKRTRAHRLVVITRVYRYLKDAPPLNIRAVSEPTRAAARTISFFVIDNHPLPAGSYEGADSSSAVSVRPGIAEP